MECLTPHCATMLPYVVQINGIFEFVVYSAHNAGRVKFYSRLFCSAGTNLTCMFGVPAGRRSCYQFLL